MSGMHESQTVLRQALGNQDDEADHPRDRSRVGQDLMLSPAAVASQTFVRRLDAIDAQAINLCKVVSHNRKTLNH